MGADTSIYQSSAKLDERAKLKMYSAYIPCDKGTIITVKGDESVRNGSVTPSSMGKCQEPLPSSHQNRGCTETTAEPTGTKKIYNLYKKNALNYYMIFEE